MDFEMDFEAGDIQSRSDLLPFSSDPCTTRTPPAVASGQLNQQGLLADDLSILRTHTTGVHDIPHSKIAKSVSQKNRTTLVPPIVSATNTQRQLRSQKNRDRLYQKKMRLLKRTDLSCNAEATNRTIPNAIPPTDTPSCLPLILSPCACPLCPRRFNRYGLIKHL